MGLKEKLKRAILKLKAKKSTFNLHELKEKIQRKREEKKVVNDIEKELTQKTKRKDEIKKAISLQDIRKIRLKKEHVKKERYKLKNYLQKAGIALDPQVISKRMFNICIIINLLVSAYVIYFFSTNYNYTIYYAIINMALIWTVIFAVILLIIWLAFHLMLDLRIFHRKTTIEQVLPDFLQLTSANIRAGMPIDQSLWYAVRPRFGILAKEIELVAKETMGGVELKDALQSFANKYDSEILRRSINMLIEGMEAGGEIGELLNRISMNISDSQILQKEMAANVTTYVIFIGFATLVAAPFLFALSSQLLAIMTKLTANVEIPSGVSISFSKIAIEKTDFMIYATLSLLITSFFSAVIVAIIKKGSVTAGFKYIPRFMIITLIIYYSSLYVIQMLFANLV